MIAMEHDGGLRNQPRDCKRHRCRQPSDDRRLPGTPKPRWARRDATVHLLSFSMFRVVTGIGWIRLYALMNSGGLMGQAVGGIVSEWTQIFGLVLLTMIDRATIEVKSP